jgi:hypothetical protein
MARPHIREREHLVLKYALLVLLASSPIWLLEGGGRVLVWLQYGVPGKSYGLWRHDAVLGAQHQENAYNAGAQTNDWGFRGTEDVLVERPRGALRIIAYGGSTTFCYNLSEVETWPARLQARLRETRGGDHDQVLNAGAVFWSLGHAFARAKKDIAGLRPDYVLIYSGINEEYNASCLRVQGIKLSDELRAGRVGTFATNFEQNSWYARHLVSYRFARYRLLPLLGSARPAREEDRPHEPDPALLENYERTLAEFIQFATASGARSAFVLQLADPQRPERQRLLEYSRAGWRIARRLGIDTVDPTALLGECGGTVFAPSGIHYTAAGADCLAQEILQQVQFERRAPAGSP